VRATKREILDGGLWLCLCPRVSVCPSVRVPESLSLSLSASVCLSARPSVDLVSVGVGMGRRKEMKKLLAGMVAFGWKKESRLPAGLHNLGNTCYMSAAIQVHVLLEARIMGHDRI
jgi:ubiquitin C-terminal hydrolase